MRHIMRVQRESPSRGTTIARAKRMRREPTEAEARVWHRVRANRLGGFHFRRQQPIGEFIADFYCVAAELVVEINGASHEEQVGYDDSRDRFLNAMGLEVLRVSNERVMNEIDKVMEEILDACERRKRMIADSRA
jgi:very-short-patch-repair endonuclease